MPYEKMVSALKGAVVDALEKCGDERVPDLASLGVATDALVELTDYLHGASEACRLIGSALDGIDGRGGNLSAVLFIGDGEDKVQVFPNVLYSEKVDLVEGLAEQVNNSLSDEEALWHRSQVVAYRALVNALGDVLPSEVTNALETIGQFLVEEAEQHGYTEDEIGQARTRELIGLLQDAPTQLAPKNP